MKTQITLLLCLTAFLFSCNSNDDEPIEDIVCDQENNKVEMNRFVTSDKESNDVLNSYSYNELNLLSARTRTSLSRVYEYEYIYDCSNNLIERNVEETIDPEYDGSRYFYEYDDQNRLIAHRTSTQGYFDYSLSYNANIVSVSGTVWYDENVSLSMQLNDQGRVSRMDLHSDRDVYNEISYTLFDYDTNGNMIKAEDYDEASNLIHSISILYDANTNPYYDQFTSIYLQRFILKFYNGAYWGSDTISSDAFNFPYLKNNIQLVVDNLCDNCYAEVIERVYTYDEQAYPNEIVNSYWGAPPTTLEVQYN